MKVLRLCLCMLLLMSYSAVFCQYDSLKPGGIYASDFTIDDIPRSITYYMPADYGKNDSYPLIIFLHDDQASAKNSIKMYGSTIHTKADAASCIVMYPDAIGGHWHSQLNNSASNKDSVNDVSFIGLMLGFFIQQYHCDVNRIYLMGIGNGGNMCYRFHCERQGKPTAIVTINTLSDTGAVQDCNAKEAIPVSAMQKETDIKNAIGKGLDFLLMQRKKE